MSWAWCLPAGFRTPLPYFYVIFFAILLVHRHIRDDEACEKKWVGLGWADGIEEGLADSLVVAWQVRQGLGEVQGHRAVEVSATRWNQGFSETVLTQPDFLVLAGSFLTSTKGVAGDRRGVWRITSGGVR